MSENFSKKAGSPKRLRYKYNGLNHPKVRDQDLDFIEKTYPKLLLTQINIEYNGGVSFHRQHNDTIDYLQSLSGSESTYGARLFLYMVKLAQKRGNTGFKVSLNPYLFQAKKNDDDVSYNSWVHTLEAATREGYGTLYLGDGSEDAIIRDGESRKYVSVFELTKKSFKLFDGKNPKLDKEPKFKQDKRNSITLTERFIRGAKEWDKPYAKQVKGIKPYYQSINDLNEFLLKFEFRDHHGVVFDPQMVRKFLVYNDNRKANLPILQSYGRYTNIVQTMTRKARALNIINGEPVIEMDYGSNHARIAYERENTYKDEYFKPYYIKPSESPLKGTEEAKRAVYKLAMMMLFNSGNPTKSLADDMELTMARVTSGEDLPERMKVFSGLEVPERHHYSEIIQKIKQNNSEIIHYFNGKQAPILQNIDSRIAEQVMLILKDQEIPFVCMHDSFQVPKSKGVQLYKAMVEAWDRVLGNNDCCVVDGKCSHAQKIIDDYQKVVYEDQEDIVITDTAVYQDGELLF